MLSTRRFQFAVIACTTCTYGFVNFDVEPTCIPDPTRTFSEDILPHLCKFEEGAEDWSGFDCTDIPEECTSDVEAQLTWAMTKRYKESQGTDRLDANCRGLGNVLSRDVKFPECVFGEPVPETRVGTLLDVAIEARELAEKILSGNPTSCSAYLGHELYDIFGLIYRQRLSEVAAHGLRINPEFKLIKYREAWDSETNKCNSETNNWRPTSETPEEIEARLSAKDFKFSRKVFNMEECTLIRHYNGSSFAKPHPGGFLGCKAECMEESSCNAFNMDLKYDLSSQNKQASCDLLECPSGASKLDKVGYVSFERKQRKRSRAERLRKKNKQSKGGLRRLE